MSAPHFQNYLGLRVAYNGSAYSGSQWQPKKISVQEKLEEMSDRLFALKSRPHFLSRTDAGVHAWDQVVLLPSAESCLEKIPARKIPALIPSMNALLPEDIRVWNWGLVRSSFDFKNDVVSKTYSYFIFNSPVWDPSLPPQYFWRRRSLSLDKIKAQLKSIEGFHDFAAFAKSSGRHRDKGPESCKRKILRTDCISKPHPRIPEANFIELRLEGTGFLQHMVRNIVGSLVDHLEGRVGSLRSIRLGKKREQGGRSAPAQALFLRKTKLKPRIWRIHGG